MNVALGILALSLAILLALSRATFTSTGRGWWIELRGWRVGRWT